MIDKVGHRRTLIVGALMLGFLLLVTAAANAGHGGYPNSIAVLGHSGATGESSDPNKPLHYEARENSWATGTNPAVKSLYLRLLSREPEDRRTQLQPGAGWRGRPRPLQAGDGCGAEAKPPPRPVRDPDLGQRHPLQRHGRNELPEIPKHVTSALKALAKGAPDAHIFVVSQFGSPGTAIATATLAQRKQFGGGKGLAMRSTPPARSSRSSWRISRA